MACFHTSKRRPRQTECERTGWHRSVCFFLACSLAGLEVDHDVRLRVTLRRITTPRCRGALVSPRRLPRSLVRIICPRPRLSSSYTRIRFRRTRRTQRLNEGGEGRFRSGPPGRRGRLRGTRDAMYKEDWYAPPPVSRFKHVSKRESTMSTISGCRPMGAATKCAIPGCLAAASAASVGMSSCQCLPGERKNGLTATVVAPCSTHLPKACSMSGSAISMCASSTIGRPDSSLYILTNSSSRSFEAFRLDPWSTMTTPNTSSAAEARVHDDDPPRPRSRYRDRRGPARRRAKGHGVLTVVPAPRMVN